MNASRWIAALLCALGLTARLTHILYLIFAAIAVASIGGIGPAYLLAGPRAHRVGGVRHPAL
jgi:hypothetical protein